MRFALFARVVASLALLALAGCSTLGGTSTPPTNEPPATNAAAATELAYVGSDGNVWEMAWPGGVPKRLTTDAQKNAVSYLGLAWSPDGEALAVERLSGLAAQPTADLLLLAPDGTVILQVPMNEARYDTPFAWSPDSHQIAYRALSPHSSISNPLEDVVLVNAHTGATVQTLTYQSDRGGCGGGGFPPLEEAIGLAHHSDGLLDTFVWSPDEQNILLSQGCTDSTAVEVNVQTGAQTPNVPIGAHFQPGGTILLGLWSDGTLGLTDLAAKPVRALLSAPRTVPGYDISLGTSTWSPDGKVVYFEHNNGIWRINADGSGLQQLIAGAADDAHLNATVVLVPSLSPDGKLLLYLTAQGSDAFPASGTTPLASTQWYVSHADGSTATALPQGISEALWQPKQERSGTRVQGVMGGNGIRSVENRRHRPLLCFFLFAHSSSSLLSMVR